MQKKLEAMLGSQLFGLALLQDKLEQTEAQLAAANTRIKVLEDKYEPKEVKGKTDGTE